MLHLQGKLKDTLRLARYERHRYRYSSTTSLFLLQTDFDSLKFITCCFLYCDKLLLLLLKICKVKVFCAAPYRFHLAL